MWFRIELNKDGSIRSATQSPVQEPGCVEAKSIADACALIERYRKYRLRIASKQREHREAGRCNCGRPRVAEKKRCLACIERARKSSETYRLRKAGAIPPGPPQAKTPDLQARNAARQREAQRRRGEKLAAMQAKHGLCSLCPNVARPGRVLCIGCAHRMATRKRSRLRNPWPRECS